MPTISMAMLQGYLLRHKDNAPAAAENVSNLASGEFSYRAAAMPLGISKKSTVKVGRAARPVHRITAFDLDRMPFNPQQGWDADIR